MPKKLYASDADRQRAYRVRMAAQRVEVKQLRDALYWMGFTVKWSDEDGEWVGLHSKYPSLSCLADTELGALVGIVTLVGDVERGKA